MILMIEFGVKMDISPTIIAQKFRAAMKIQKWFGVRSLASAPVVSASLYENIKNSAEILTKLALASGSNGSVR